MNGIYFQFPGSVSIVSVYKADELCSIPDRSKGFFPLPCVQTGSVVHSTSYPAGTGGPFPGVNRGRCVTVTTYPHLVLR
jgi:hypothetical protein